MAQYKLRNILKVVNSTRITITIKNDPNTHLGYKTYNVDYLSERDGIAYDGPTHMECSCINYLPENILDRRVTFIDGTFDNGVGIQCYR